MHTATRPSRRRSAVSRILTRFLRAQQGATAVEFAFVALPFLVMVFAVFDLGLLFLAQTTLQNATDQASRLLRTGQQTQSTGVTQAAFKNTICDEMGWVTSDCKAKLVVDVRVYTSFAAGLADPNPTVFQKSATAPNDPTQNTFHPEAADFKTGDQEQIVLVRVYYPWKVLMPLKNDSLINLAGGSHLISASATFRNEPWK